MEHALAGSKEEEPGLSAQEEPEGPQSRTPAFTWRALLEIFQALVLAVVISVVLNLFVVQVTEVRQRSMELTLLQGDRVLVSKVDYRLGPPQPGDMLVFNPTTEAEIPFVKRVVAIAGEIVELRDGRLYVDGQLRDFPGVHGSTLAQNQQIHYPFRVPDGYFFALGDNREASSDSRSFGPQPYGRIVGKVILRFWPLDRVTFFTW